MAKETKKKPTVKITKQEKDAIKKEITKEIKDEIKNSVEAEVVDSVVETIKKESKDKIQNDFVNDVKLEVKEQIIKEEKRLLRTRKWKVFRRDLVIIILLALIGYLSYLIYKGFTINIDINTNKEVISKDIDTKDSEVTKDKTWYIKNYGYLINYIHLKLPGENINKYYLYNHSYNDYDINSSIKLSIAYNFLDKSDITRDNGKYIIDNKDMVNAYKKIFNTEYVASTFTIDCMTYNLKDNHYEGIINSCSSINNYEIKEEIIDMYEENNDLIIQTVMGVVEDTKLYNYMNLYAPITDSYNNNLLEYKDNLNKYKYTFRKNNNEYKFVKIEKE